MYFDISLIAAIILLYGCVAKRIERSCISGPLIFITAGYIFGPHGFGILTFNTSTDTIRVLAELTLAVVLFNDATGIGVKPLRQHPQIPTRTLLFGLPITLLLGAVCAKLIFPQLSWIEAGLLSSVLAPTDAALGLAVIKNRHVPAEIRRGINAESGLNDGICVPFLLVFLELATGHVDNGSIGSFAITALIKEIGIGLVVGPAITFVVWRLIRCAIKAQWISEQWLIVPALAMGILAFSLAQLLGGSGFIAAFCGGLLFGEKLHGAYHEEIETNEIDGEILSLLTWLLFGTLAMNIIADIRWPHLVYAALSLTVIRMLPIVLSLVGTPLAIHQKLFIGWFGPRGLASIVFAIMILESHVANAELIVNTATTTVILSVLLHGITANPLAKRLNRGNRQTHNQEAVCDD